MASIKLDTVPHLCTYFDPIKWPEQNPMVHPEVYKLNPAQLKMWGEEATEIRKKIIKKSEWYKLYSEKIPEAQIDVAEKSRKSVPHSTRASNPEGLLESQIMAREKLYAGNTK
jgi:tRNA A37 threonylcarbamoyladenosine biosynthesis protein TsaE